MLQRDCHNLYNSWHAGRRPWISTTQPSRDIGATLSYFILKLAQRLRRRLINKLTWRHHNLDTGRC